MSPRRFIFNLYQAPELEGVDEVKVVYANDPVILLEESQPRDAKVVLRHFAQRGAIQKVVQAQEDVVDDPMFGTSLDWRYREFIVHRLWNPDERENLRKRRPAPLGNRPPQTVVSRRLQLERAYARLLETSDQPAKDEGERLYLFNVIVALEWIPSPKYIRQLEWAFRRASDLLYDVTNGCMAFGQVVFGDAAWMGCADIQIMASNRFLPRSWVSGLLEEEKYKPIRVGRGVWDRKRQVVIGWDESEGYGALVHEWLHYALGLKDEYLETLSVRAQGNVLTKVDGTELSTDATIVIPRQRITSESIMATAEGNSEVDYPLAALPDNVKEYYPWDKLNKHLAKEFAGPGRLPLALPNFHRVGKLGDGSQTNELTVYFPFVARFERENQADATLPDVLIDEDGAPYESWEVYVLHPRADETERVIAQGEIDARSAQRGFQLLGVEQDDDVVLVKRYQGGSTVWSSKLPRKQDAKKLRRQYKKLIKAYKEYTLAQKDRAAVQCIDKAKKALDAAQSTVDEQQLAIHTWKQVLPSLHAQVELAVVPDPVESLERPQERLHLLGVSQERAATLFELGRAEGKEIISPEKSINVTALDGHVLLRANGELTIHAYSEGGGPISSPNVRTNPIAAGSANGDVLLFFHADPDASEADKRRYAAIRVITTTLHDLPAPTNQDGLLPRSPVYSIASNAQLPPDLAPTLLILTDATKGLNNGQADNNKVCICRLDRDEWKWVEMPTYTSAGATFAATPLAADLQATLLKEPCEGERVEYYRLYGKPHNETGVTSGTANRTAET